MLDRFAESLGAYVRQSDGELFDGRSEAAAQVLRLDVGAIIKMMADVPEDLAAMLSGIVGVERNNERVIELMSNASGDRALGELFVMLVAKAHLPLVGKPESGVNALLAGLIETATGRRLYFRVAKCLSWARGRSDLVDILYIL